MRKKIKIFITFGILLILGGIFYYSLPFIWAESLYPLEYKEIIAHYAQVNKLDPNFVAAVIRAESGFSPKAVSHKGARGLMQIMPQTASGIATALKEPNYNADRLFDPDLNIKFGTYYLRNILDRYNQSYELTLITYNAGGSVTEVYQQKRKVLPRETSNFVRKVMSNYQFYQKIYGQWWGDVKYTSPLPEPTPSPLPIYYNNQDRNKMIIDFLDSLMEK